MLPVRGLVEPVCALMLNAMLRKLAWSRSGCLAYITKNAHSIGVVVPQFQTRDGTWNFNRHLDPSFPQQISNVFQTHELVHVSWNPYGSELMIVDEVGRIALCIAYIVLNRLVVTRVISPDPEDGLRSIVGAGWLPHQIRRVSHFTLGWSPVLSLV